jgi:hypothetical protein
MSSFQIAIFGALVLILSVGYTAVTGWLPALSFAVIIILGLALEAAVKGW